MKFRSLFVSLVAATTSLAAVPRSSLTRGAARHDVIAARQAHVQRDLIDVCAGLDVDFEVLNIVFGHLDVCLCIGLLPDFIEVDVVAQAAVAVAGETVVLAQLEALINAADGKQTCNYPTHASPICSFDWPCGFDCSDGYSPFTPPGSPYPTECTCPAPLMECNGQCGHFPGGCGSAVPRKKRNAPSCAAGKQLCGIAGGSSGKGWECVDTTSDLESCGGCMAPSPFAPLSAAIGIDCSAIPNVASVACHISKCVVSACVTGFVPSLALDACVVDVTLGKRDLADAAALEDVTAEVHHLAAVGEVGDAGLHVARDLLGLGAVEGLGAVVAPIAAVGEAGAAGVKVLRDVGIVEGVEADIAHVAEVGEHAAAGVHFKRDLLDLVGADELGALVSPIAAVDEASIVGAHVARGLLDVVGGEGVGALVAPVAGVAEVGGIAGHVARDLPVVEDVPVLGAVVDAAVGAVVPDVLDVGALAGAGVTVI